ncbi:MAG: translocation/assembly module TamB [Gemmatimonadaceae bacterium]|nr:translocation/assembly module TamB [Gemmatimonadaceae bacterium]
MSRRRFVAMVSGLSLVVLGLLVGLVVVLVTQTPYGRDRVRDIVESRLKPAVHGRLYVGKIHGGLLGGVVVDSLEIRDPEDSLVMASGPIRLEYDPRDLLDKRVLLTYAELTRPVFYARRHENGDWNFRRTFPGKKGPDVPKVERGFGDFIVADSVTIHDGSFILTMPWHAPDSLRGAKLDSAVRTTLASDDHEVQKTSEGYAKTWRWTGINVESPYVRIADPDSVGQLFTANAMSVRESDPPFLFTNTTAAARLHGDSLWLNVSHFDLPASHGSAKGKVVWGSDLPVRYAIDVDADTVSLADIAWVYPTLPTAGGGKAHLRIVNDPKNLDVIEYQLSRMDVRSTKSHLTGAMTFAVGEPVLAVKNLDVVAAPIDFAFIRALNGKPFPVDWQGTISGTLKGRGGPLTNFRVDDANLVFRDAHVPGAETRATAKGELDILYPAFTVFHGLDVNVASGDLRTIQYLYPNFPKLKGTISGTATLDSSWLDVRFSNGDLYLRDGPDEPTHVTGSGRVTYGDVFMTYDLNLDAKLLSLTQLARSYPTLPLRGIVAGPIVAKGTTEALDVTTTLAGDAGTVAFNGRLDTYPPGYAVRGTTTLTHLDARTLLERADGPKTDISARFDTDVSGDSLANFTGRIAADLVGGSMVDGVRLFSGRARMDAANGKLRVDSLALESTAATVFASGGIGLADGTRDSLRFALFVDSLGGLRRWIATAPTDSLDGSFSISGVLSGSVNALDARGTMTGASLYRAGTSASAVKGTFALRDLTKQPTGDVIFGVDTTIVAGVVLSRVDGLVALDGAARGRVSLEARETTGQSGRASGEYFVRGDTVEARVDSLSFVADTAAATARCRLVAPARIVAAAGDLTLSPTRLEDGKGGVVALALTLPAQAPIGGSLVVEKAAISDFARMAQLPVPLGGLASLRASFAGTRESPIIEWTSLLQQPQTAGVRLDRIEGDGRYADRVFTGTARFYRDRAATMVANVALPLDLAFAPRAKRLLPDPLHGSVRADSADLAVLETLAPGLDITAGRFTVAADLGGTWARPTLDGRISVSGGAATIGTLGVRVRGVAADIVMRGDSIAVQRFVAQSDDPGERGTISAQGYLDLDYLHHRPGVPSNQSFVFDVVARGFHALNQRRLGDLRISSPGLHLAGTMRSSALTGTVVVDKGVVYIPELTKKRVVDLSDTTLTDLTGLGRTRPLVPDAPPSLVAGLALENVRLVIGPDVWLRSAEAAIQLGGEVNVTKGRDPRAGSIGDLAPEQLALQGTLTADRGQYRLELSPAISRTFDVTRGRLTFSGDPDLNPALDINAVHTVRTENGQDIRVRVAIRGTLLNPELVLSSDEGLQISQTDLVSYLAFGKPSFEVTGSSGVGYNQLGLGLLSLSAGGFVASQVQKSRFGSAIDVFSVQAGADATSPLGTTQPGNPLLNRIANSRVTLGKQINERTYIGHDAGLCELTPGAARQTTSQSALTTFYDRLGLTVNHRLAHGFSVSGGVEPSASAKQCTDLTGAAAQITTAPRRQIGLDLTRSWTF